MKLFLLVSNSRLIELSEKIKISQAEIKVADVILLGKGGNDPGNEMYRGRCLNIATAGGRGYTNLRNLECLLASELTHTCLYWDV
jgi:hypothetical protein